MQFCYTSNLSRSALTFCCEQIAEPLQGRNHVQPRLGEASPEVEYNLCSPVRIQPLSIIDKRLVQSIIRKLNLQKFSEPAVLNPCKIDFSSFFIPHISKVDIIAFRVFPELGKLFKLAGYEILGSDALIAKNITCIIEIDLRGFSDRPRKPLR